MAATTTRKSLAGFNQPVTKTADNKGRIVLGASFANRHVIIEQITETEIVVKMARVIPESEAWLYNNPTALNSVRAGLAQARAGELVEGPDVAADKAFAAKLEG
jgi:hypothetical protein